MFKKFIFSLLLFIFSFSFYVFGAGIGDVSLVFCQWEPINESWTNINNTKDLKTSVDGGKEKDICMQLTNNSNKDMVLKMNFVDATITNDSFKMKACKDESQVKTFWQYIDWPKESFLLPSKSTIEKHATMKFPEGYGWVAFGCVTYFQSAALESTGTDMFQVMVRKANFIEVAVSWNIALGLEMLDIKNELSFPNLSDSPKIWVFFDESEKNLIIHAGVKNVWTVPQSVIITGIINNIFGYEKIFLSDSTTVLPGESLIHRSSVENMPFYWWPFFVDIDVDYIPIYENATDVSIGNTKVFNNLNFSVSVFVMSFYIRIMVWIIFIVILFALFKKSKSKTNSKKKKFEK